MINQPLVSVIIPTYNRASFIRETLDSVLKQTYTHWECIVVDDGSDDDTETLMQDYCDKDIRFKFLKRPKERLKGANACRNYGFENSRGDYIQWFDSDDILRPTKIEDQLNDLIHSKQKISLCNFSMFQGSINNIDPMDAGLKKDGESTFLSYISGKSLLNTQIAFFDRAIVENFKFDEKLHQSQDLDFMYRLLKEHYNKVSVLNKALCYIRKHSDSITIRFRRGSINELKSDIEVRETIFFDMYSSLPNDEIKRGLLHRTLYSYRSLLVHGHIKLYYKKMNHISTFIDFKKKLKLYLLVSIGTLYALTKKGLYTYGKVLQTI